MKPATLFALVLAIGVAAVSEAPAADVGIARPAPPMLEEYGSGWYLRGDVGWTGYTNVSADYVIGGLASAHDSSAKLEDTWSIGAGYGYNFDWFRADVTADYRANAQFTGIMGELFGELTTWSTLLNGYFDLGTWSGITPYVGAGIGAAYHETRKWHDLYGDPVFAGGSNWELAWAVMAGLAIQFTPKASLDVGYRYVDLGKAESGLDADFNAIKVKTDNISAHEVRVGIRYTID